MSNLQNSNALLRKCRDMILIDNIQKILQKTQKIVTRGELKKQSKIGETVRTKEVNELFGCLHKAPEANPRQQKLTPRSHEFCQVLLDELERALQDMKQ